MLKNTNTIDLATAQAWAARWRENPNNTVKAFLIPAEDITQLMDEPQVQDVRAYVGIDDEGEHHLMLVGTDRDGRDLINENEKQYIYDFTMPCPNTCDPGSPLFDLK